MRAFVGFFGLNRSARWTLPSIRHNLLNPLRNAGFDLYLAGHFNQPEMTDDAGGKSRSARLYDSVKPFALDLACTEPQLEVNIADMLPAALSVPYHYRPDVDGQRRRNLLHQLHSLRRLDQLLAGIGQEFDVYVLLRPDIEYIDRLDVKELDPILAGEADMVSPGWEEWDGLNDRFAFCNRKAAAAYLNRWQLLDAFCKTYGYMHSERLLAYAIQTANLRVIKTDMRALRVRRTGWTSTEGFRLPPLMRLKHRARRLLGAFGA